MAQEPRDLDTQASVLGLFGAEVRHWRELRGMSQARLGRRVHVSGDLIGKIEKAQRRASFELAERLDVVLDTGGVLSRLTTRIERRLPSTTQAGPLQHQGTNPLDTAPSESRSGRPESSADPLTDPVDPTDSWQNRLTMAKIPMELLDLVESSNVGTLGIGDLHDQITCLARSYVHEPLPLLMDRLLVTRDRLSFLLHGHQPLSTRRDLLLLAGAALGMLAHACDDLGLVSIGHTHARAALACAQDCGHPGLQGWIMGTASKLAVWRGDLRTAAQLAHRAVEQAPDGNTRARAAALEARAWARAGVPDRATEALRVCQLLGETPADDDLAQWGGIFTFPAAKQSYYAANVHLWLNDPTNAITAAMRAVDLYDSGPPQERSYGDLACAQADLLTAHLQAGDVARAAVVASALAGLSPQHHIASVRAHLRTAQTAVPPPSSGTQALVLRDQLARILALMPDAGGDPT